MSIVEGHVASGLLGHAVVANRGVRVARVPEFTEYWPSLKEPPVEYSKQYCQLESINQFISTQYLQILQTRY